MPTFGENLRREREMRGISLEEISAATKISIRFLQALENDDFASVPGGIFIRGFIRAYAGYLGLDQEQVMAEYQSVAQSENFELSRLSSANRPARKPGRRIAVLPLVVAVALLISGYALFRYSHRVALAPTPAPSPAPPAAAAPAHDQSGAPTPSTAPPNAAAPGTSSANPREGAASPEPQTATPPSSTGLNPAAVSLEDRTKPAAPLATTGAAENAPVPQEGLVLQLAATEPVWVSVEADGKTILQRVVRPNDVTSLRAKEYFDVTAGNAQGLILTLNGETLKPLGREGEVKKIHLTRADVKSASPPDAK
jgi:cytoskeleton protein RodZ